MADSGIGAWFGHKRHGYRRPFRDSHLGILRTYQQKDSDSRRSSFSYFHSVLVHIPVPSMPTQRIRDSYEVCETRLPGLHS